MANLPRWQLHFRRSRNGAAPESIEFRCDELNVGRAHADLTLASPQVSRHHCEFNLDETGRLLVTDCGSTNGTFLNDRRIDPAHSEVVRVGDLLRIGDWYLELHQRPELVVSVMERSARLEAARDRAGAHRRS